jgi:D-lactate dehydrogenase (cytochrome)
MLHTPDASFVAALAREVDAARVSTAERDRAAAAGDASSLPPMLPDVVVWPETTAEVAAIVTRAAAAGVAVTARGAGSSLEGNPIPVHGGVVLDLTRMHRILAVRVDDLQVDVQPGVVYAALNRALRSHGLFFPPAPGGSSEVATIGGMAANDASGIYAVKYGATRAHVRAATVVTGTGAVLRLGSRCRKTSSGYHLIGLLVGSEGTLAIATEITLALAGLPPARRQGAFYFATEIDATRAVADLMRFGCDVAAIEFLDRHTMAALEAFGRFGLEARPALLLETHGTDTSVREAWAGIVEVCRSAGGAEVALPGGRDVWSVRAHVTRAIQAGNPEAAIVRVDLAVPVSSIPDLVAAAHRLGSTRGVPLYTFGHAGLGILHVLSRVTGGVDPSALAAAATLRDDLVHAALRLGGSVSGEHGIGIGNRAFLRHEHGPAVDLMQGIKTVFDPAGILNPGKLW